MAVTIFSNPAALTPLENGFEWVIQLGDLGADPEIKRAGWILETSAGAVVAEKSSTRPGSTGDKIRLNFTKNVRGLIKATMPTAGVAPGVQQDSTIIKEFRLKYGDIVINKDTGAVTDNVTNTTGNYKVFNGGNNIWDSALITATGLHILSCRPLEYNILRGSLDYLWILGSTTITYTVYYYDGTSQNIVQSAPYDANIVPMGLPFLASLLTGGHTTTDVAELAVAITGGPTYTVGFENICDDQTSFLEVLFLEPAGGRSCMVFNTIDDAGTGGSKTTANIHKTISSISDLRNAGDSVISSRIYGQYGLRRFIGTDPDEIRWCHAFGAATEHHLLLTDRGGTRYWGKFILDGQPSINLQSKEMTASGRLAEAIRVPYSL